MRHSGRARCRVNKIDGVYRAGTNAHILNASFCGLSLGAAGVLVGHPFDTVKVGKTALTPIYIFGEGGGGNVCTLPLMKKRNPQRSLK